MKEHSECELRALPTIIESAMVFGSSEPINEEQLYSMHELHNINIIYNLLEKPNEELKNFWEGTFKDCKYITEINSVPTAIKDFEAPSQKQLDLIVTDIIKNLEAYKNVLIHCRAGLGRTGTILAALYMQLKNEHNAENAINYIRSNYSPYAVESFSQVEALKAFGDRIKERANLNDLSFASDFAARSSSKHSNKKLLRS